MIMRDIYKKVSDEKPEEASPYKATYGESVEDCIVRNLEDWADMLKEDLDKPTKKKGE